MYKTLFFMCISDYCHFEKEVGRCRAAFPRFYYDVTDRTCKTFVYGGCGGNRNNFETKEGCQNACTGVTGNCVCLSVFELCLNSSYDGCEHLDQFSPRHDNGCDNVLLMFKDKTE